MQTEDTTNIEIDFLPERFREENAQRRVHALRIIVVGAFVALVAAGGLVQQQSLRGLRSELASVSPLNEQAVAQNKKLSDLQTTLAAANLRAELATFIRHPWPRTQMLAAVLTPLPQAITVTELQVVPEMNGPVAGTVAAVAAGGDAGKPEEKPVAKPSPVEQDLKKLRSFHDNRTIVVSLVGTTRDVSALHAYLAQVAEHALMAKVELKSLGQALEGADQSLFHARMYVRPAYGQKGGPTRE